MYSQANPRLSLLLGLLLTLGGGTLLAATVAEQTTIEDPYIRAVPPVVKTSAAFLRITSSAETERFIVDARTPAAGAIELHMHIHDDGVMRMRRIPHIHLPPDKTVSLEPGGLHVMLFDLQRPLSEGERIPLTLVFDDGSEQTVEAEVRRAGGSM